MTWGSVVGHHAGSGAGRSSLSEPERPTLPYPTAAVRARKLEAARRRLHMAMLRLEPYDGGPIPERAAYWAEREAREALRYLAEARGIGW